MKTFRAFFLLCILAACGNDTSGSLFEMGLERLKTGKQSGKPVSLEQQRAALVANVRNAPGSDPILLVELTEKQVVATMVVGQTSRGNAAWFDLTGASVVTRNGVARATRGLGADLMSSDVSGTVAALRGGATRYTRFHRYLDGEGAAVDFVFTCNMARGGGSYQETCTTEQGTISNTYEMNGGTVVRSRQWIGPDIGYANLTKLR